MKSYLALIGITATLTLSACGDNKQAQLEQQLKAQQEQIAQQQAQLSAIQASGVQQDTTVYQLNESAVNETLSPEAQAQGKSGEVVTGNDGQQYMYDSSTGSWFLQSLIGAAAGAFIGNALANKFSRAPANNPVAQQVRTQHARQYTGRTAQAPTSLSPRQQAAQDQQRRQTGQQANSYRQTNQAPSNYQQPRRKSAFGSSRGFGRRR